VTPTPDRLDWTDPAAVRLWLHTLRVAWDEAAGVSEDMLRPPRKRSLGPRMHGKLYFDAAGSVESLLAFAGAPESGTGDGEGDTGEGSGEEDTGGG
jgi:hypothetical protein